MPTQYLPFSESEQQFASLVDRIFTDKDFAGMMESDPASALEKHGYKLTATQRRTIKQAKLLSDTELMAASGIISKVLTSPAVSVITKGTKPAVSVITKGTKPAVSVAVNSVVAAKPSTEPVLTVTTTGVKTAKPRATRRRKTK